MAVGIEPLVAIRALEGATPAFGRLEEVRLDERRVVLALAKNPASLTESGAIAAGQKPDGILLGLSDEAADGRDVSWIWDVDFDALSTVPCIGLTGTRANDLALRLKYSARATPGRWPIVTIDPQVDRALEATLSRVPRGGTMIVLATYTAMLAIRASLQRRGVVSALPT
jgi:UDP-N-acetylmuramyl tripeptide synthase